MKISRNRANGKKYEGELVKALRERGVYARLGRSNEEADVILPDLNVLIEAKSTSRPNFRMSMNQKTKDQFQRLLLVPARVFYAVRYKGKGLNGWRFHPLPDSVQVLYRDEGLTLDEFLLSLMRSRPEEVPA